MHREHLAKNIIKNLRLELLTDLNLTISFNGIVVLNISIIITDISVESCYWVSSQCITELILDTIKPAKWEIAKVEV